MLKTTAEKLNSTLVNINELLNFEHEFEKMNSTSCNLHQLVDQIINSNHHFVTERNAIVENNIPNDLNVSGFPAYLDSIFYNLITNALKYGVTDESKNVDINAKKQGGKIYVEVVDHGIGIDLEKHGKRIFKLGSRLQSDNYDGQGLGLFMTKRQVEALGGSINIDSSVNRGAKFIVELNEC